MNGKAPGNTPLLTQVHRQALLEIVESGPIPAVHGVVRWRLIDLAQWVFDEFRISISKQTALGHLMLGQGSKKARRRPTLLVGLSGEVGPDLLDGGKSQLDEEQRETGGVDGIGRFHAAPPARTVPSSS